MYGHGGLYFPRLCANRVRIQEVSVGPIGPDV